MEETLAYTASVEYIDETLPERDGKPDTSGIEFVIFAKSYSEVEKIVKEQVGESLVKIHDIGVMDAVPLF